MPRWPLDVRPSWSTAVGVMTLITRQCFAIPTSSREPLEIVRSTKRTRRGPAGRTSERQRRSDLICDRETSRLLTIAPVPSMANLHHLRIHLFPHPPSTRVSRLTSARPSYLFLLVVSLLSSLVVREPPCALNLSPQLNIRAFAF